MGIRGDIAQDWHAALAALAWQLDLGADEAICETPQSAYDLPEKAPWQLRSAPAAAAVVGKQADMPVKIAAAEGPALADCVAAAAARAMSCTTLTALDGAAADFEFCDLRKGARGAVAGLGPAQANLLVICDPPSLDAEKAGQALIGDEAVLLEKIFAAISLSLHSPNPNDAFHLVPSLPWPLRGAADVHAAALAMMRPFLLRRIALIQPKAVVVMGHIALGAVLQSTGLARLRGQWHPIDGRADHAYSVNAMPMYPPSHLIKNPVSKRDAWADALSIKAVLRASLG